MSLAGSRPTIRPIRALFIGTAAALAGMVVSQVAMPQPDGGKTNQKFEAVDGHKSSLKRDLSRQEAPAADRMPARPVLIAHLQSLELASRVYTEQQPTRAFVFGDTQIRENFLRLLPQAASLDGSPTSLENQFIASQFSRFDWQPVYHWQVLDIAKQTEVKGGCARPGQLKAHEITARDWGGFRAVSYVNHRARRVVVAIAGTNPWSLTDWNNDLTALMGETAPYFDVACAYMQHIIATYQPRFENYEFECAGHSLGGGACSYAASRLGRRGVTLNPIGTVATLRVKPLRIDTLSGEQAERGIFNYVDPGDPAYHTYKAANRVHRGAIYWIEPRQGKKPESLLGRVSKFLMPKRTAVERAWATYQAHQATTSLDRLVNFENLTRIR